MDIQRRRAPEPSSPAGNANQNDEWQPKQLRKETLFAPVQIKEKPERKNSFTPPSTRTVAAFFSVFVAAFLCYGLFFAWKTFEISKKMNPGASRATFTEQMRSIISPIMPSRKTLAGEADGRINILLLGAAGEHNPGGNLTDTIMIMSIDTQNKKVALLSLPRDLFVQIPGTKTSTKINSLYQIGLSQNEGASLIEQSVTNITGLPIHYYVALDFEGFKKIIDILGGINVMVERDMYDQRYPGPNYSYETFSITKGFHQLDGDIALKYVRERHDDPQGDFGRARRQQQVIQAVKNKFFSLKTLSNVWQLNQIFNTLGDNIRTNISFDDINSFFHLSQEVDTQNITNAVAGAWQKDSLLKVSHVQVGAVRAFVLVPRFGSYAEIQDLAVNIFHLDELKRRQTEIENEHAKIEIINESGSPQLAQKIEQLLLKLSMNDVHIAPSTASSFSQKTTIVTNNTRTLFTTDELAKKLPATVKNQDSDQSSSVADIVIHLGSDLVLPYAYADDSIEDYNNAQDDQTSVDFTKGIPTTN